MVVVPADNPVTIPLDDPTTPTEVVELDHVPGEPPSVNDVLSPSHTYSVPVIGAGNDNTFIVVVIPQVGMPI